MKNNIFFTLALSVVFSSSVKSQLSKKKIMLPDGSEVNYSMVDNSFNGPYIITTNKNVVITRGSYANDLRSGNWYFFNPDGSVFLRYNYDLKKVLALDINSLAFVDVKIFGDSEIGNVSIPIPLISIDQYVTLLSMLVKEKIPAAVKLENDKLDVQITADIDEYGKASYSAKYSFGNMDNVQKFDLVGQKFVIDWIQANAVGVNYRSSFSFNVTLYFSEERAPTDSQKRFRWN